MSCSAQSSIASVRAWLWSTTVMLSRHGHREESECGMWTLPAGSICKNLSLGQRKEPYLMWSTLPGQLHPAIVNNRHTVVTERKRGGSNVLFSTQDEQDLLAKLHPSKRILQLLWRKSDATFGKVGVEKGNNRKALLHWSTGSRVHCYTALAWWHLQHWTQFWAPRRLENI